MAAKVGREAAVTAGLRPFMAGGQAGHHGDPQIDRPRQTRIAIVKLSALGQAPHALFLGSMLAVNGAAAEILVSGGSDILRSRPPVLNTACPLKAQTR